MECICTCQKHISHSRAIVVLSDDKCLTKQYGILLCKRRETPHICIICMSYVCATNVVGWNLWFCIQGLWVWSGHICDRRRISARQLQSIDEREYIHIRNHAERKVNSSYVCWNFCCPWPDRRWRFDYSIRDYVVSNLDPREIILITTWRCAFQKY